MSDYRLNSENIGILNKVGGDENTNLSRQLNTDLNLGISSEENVFNAYERSRKSRQQRDLFRPNSPHISGNNMDISYIGEIERISSSLIKLLCETRQKYVKEAADLSQHHRLVQSSTPHDESNQALCCQADRQDMHTSIDILKCTSNRGPEHEYHMPDGMCSSSNRNTSADRLFLPTNEETEVKDITRSRSCAINVGATRAGLRKEKDQNEETYKTIEKRGSVINTNKTDIRGMLPEDVNRTKKQRKGSVMKETVDIVKELKKTQDHIRQFEDKMRERDIQIKKMSLRLERLEFFSTGKHTNECEIAVLQNKDPQRTNTSATV